MDINLIRDPNRQTPRPTGQPLRILGSRVDPVDLEEILHRIRSFVAFPHAHHVITANTLMLLAAERDTELQSILETAALVVPESWGIYWASHRLSHPLKGYLPGIDLMTLLCQMAADQHGSVFLLGGEPGIAEQAARALLSRFPKLTIAGTHHGYFSLDEEVNVLQEISAAAPTFLFVGMNMPQQEKWIHRHLADLNVRVAMGVGGSFDVLSGRLRRAPPWVRRHGIEWMYRVTQEPWRWRRIMQLPVFMWKVLRNGQ